MFATGSMLHAELRFPRVELWLGKVQGTLWTRLRGASFSMEAFEELQGTLLKSTCCMGFNNTSILAHRRIHKKGQTSIKNKMLFSFYVQTGQLELVSQR